MIEVRFGFAKEMVMELHGCYYRTCHSVDAVIRKSVPLEELKERIGCQYPYLKKEVESANTTNEVMLLFHNNHNTFPRILQLRGLVHHLQLKPAAKKINKYDKKFKKICKKVSGKGFPKNEPGTCNRNQTMQVGNNVRQRVLKCLASTDNLYFL